MKYIVLLLYLSVIAIANVVTAGTTPFQYGPIIVPAGTFFIGITFILRDIVQNFIGRKKTYYTIAVAMIISGVTSYMLGDTLWIVLASILTFAVSETTDTEIYTRLKMPLSIRVLYSGIVGGILDSVIFVIIGLSPLGANFLPWGGVLYAIIGQVLAKVVIQLIAAGLIKIVENKRMNVSQS